MTAPQGCGAFYIEKYGI